jgi:hypothetical protein
MKMILDNQQRADADRKILLENQKDIKENQKEIKENQKDIKTLMLRS